MHRLLGTHTGADTAHRLQHAMSGPYTWRGKGDKGDKGEGKGKGKDKDESKSKGDKGKGKGMGKDVIMIESDQQHITRLQSKLTASEALTTAAQATTTAAMASSTFWRQKYEELLADTLRRVRSMRQRAETIDEAQSSIERAGSPNLQHINQDGDEERKKNIADKALEP